MEIKKIVTAIGWSCRIPLGYHFELKGEFFGTLDSPLIIWKNDETT